MAAAVATDFSVSPAAAAVLDQLYDPAKPKSAEQRRAVASTIEGLSHKNGYGLDLTGAKKDDSKGDLLAWRAVFTMQWKRAPVAAAACPPSVATGSQ